MRPVRIVRADGPKPVVNAEGGAGTRVALPAEDTSVKKSEIKVGGFYKASVSGKVVTVRVDAIRTPAFVRNGKDTETTVYDVTNTVTGRKTTFRSAMKFRTVATDPKFSTPAEKAVATLATEAGLTKVPAMKLEGVGGQHQAPRLSDEPSNRETLTVIPVLGGLAAHLAAKAPTDTDTDTDTAPHVIVRARAGTGKTTTLVGALEVLLGGTPKAANGTPITPSEQQRAVWDAVALSRGFAKSVCFVAFNRSIADELKRRVPAGVDAMTNHGLGFRAVTAAFGKVRVNEYRVDDVVAELLGTNSKDLRKRRPGLVPVVKELVGLCKMNLLAGTEDDCGTLAGHYDVDLDGVKWHEVVDLVPKVLERCKDVRKDMQIDYDDMVWLPVALGLPVRRYDLGMVDEFQDTNRCQQALVKMAFKRIVACGDDRQAIYGFAGADATAMDRFIDEMGETDRGVTVIPLTVTRRCGKAIVAEARKIVPDFEAHESNPDGAVRELTGVFDDHGVRRPGKGYDAASGDMVLCRTNAPLVSECFRFIRAGVKANIQGRDVAKGLIRTVEKLKAETVAGLVAALGDWLEDETRKETAKKNPSDAKLLALTDRHDCLICFTEGLLANSRTQDVVDRINAVFTDDKQAAGIRLSSIHKAKGLEARRVFLLEPGAATVPHPMAKKAWAVDQEWNLRYVAITRAIEELVFVT